MDNKLLIAGIFFIFIILSGLWLRHAAKPINVILLTVHKLISLGALVFLAITVYRIHQVSALNPIEIAVCAITLLFFIALFVTGGLLSTGNPVNDGVSTIHKVSPILAVISTAGMIYLLFNGRF